MPELKAIGFDELKATPGKFRAVMKVDMELYQIGEDVASSAAAVQLCLDVQKIPTDRFQVYDENGEKCFRPALTATPA